MISEPAWSKEIPNSTVCTWFYALAMLNLFVGIAGVIGSIYLTSIGKLPFGLIVFMGFVAFIAFINMWFLFLMCNRALHAEGWKNHHRRHT